MLIYSVKLYFAMLIATKQKLYINMITENCTKQLVFNFFAWYEREFQILFIAAKLKIRSVEREHEVQNKPSA